MGFISVYHAIRANQPISVIKAYLENENIDVNKMVNGQTALGLLLEDDRDTNLVFREQDTYNDYALPIAALLLRSGADPDRVGKENNKIFSVEKRLKNWPRPMFSLSDDKMKVLDDMKANILLVTQGARAARVWDKTLAGQV